MWKVPKNLLFSDIYHYCCSAASQYSSTLRIKQCSTEYFPICKKNSNFGNRTIKQFKLQREVDIRCSCWGKYMISRNKWNLRWNEHFKQQLKYVIKRVKSHVSAVSILSDTSMDRVMSLSYCCLQKNDIRKVVKGSPWALIAEFFSRTYFLSESVPSLIISGK